ncbi:MAG: TonB-dependent receptor [Flavobacteriales bacterium]|nr:TonB-dependent receptor [Flavobacteriales bacterium]
MQKLNPIPSVSSLLVLTSFFLLSFGANAQTVSGSITSSDKQAVIGAYITSGTKGASSDIDGKYTLALASGTHEITCSFIGLKTTTKTITLAPGQMATLNFNLDSEARLLDMAVVSAGRFEQSVAEVTVSIEILQPALVENKATTSLESALEQVPGVSMVDGEPQIRSGSGFSYGAGSRVMVMVDDLPVLSGDAGRPNWGFLPLENLEQIEVIKGASSVLYGSAALSGVINIRTRFPDARPLTRFSVQQGVYSNPRSKASVYWHTPLQQTNIRFLHSRQLGGWDIVIGGNLLGDDGFKGPTIELDSLNTPIDTNTVGYNPLSVDRYGANSQARFNINLRRRDSAIPGLTYGLSTNWQKGESLNTLIWENSETGLYSSYAGAATRTKQLVGTVDPFVEYLSPSGVRTSFRNRWQHLVNNNNNGQGNNSDVFYSELQSQKLGAWGMEKMALTGGIVHQYTIGEAQLYTGGNEDGINTARNIAGYLQLDQPIGKRLNLSGGMRYEHFSINDDSEGKPVFRAGGNYQVAEETYIRSSFGQGFRFPTIAEKYIRTGLGVLQVYPNENLKPESSTSLEIGVKQGVKIGEFLGNLDVAVFQQRYTDFIEFTFQRWAESSDDLLNGLGFGSLNTGKSQVRGAEISLMGQAKWGSRDQHSLDILTGYTYTNPISLTPDFNYGDGELTTYLGTSHDTTGHILKYRSPHLVRFDAQWTHPKGFIGLSARYQSVLKNFDEAFITFDGLADWGLNEWLEEHPTLPWIIDLRVGFDMNDHSRISVVVSNLLNQEYSIRPLAIESPRLVNVVYTYEVN